MAMNSLQSIASYMDSVRTPQSVRDVMATHRWRPGDNPSLRKIVDRHRTSQNKLRRFLSLNTYLMDAFFPPSASKPAASHRAIQLGNVLRRDFDIALLSEVFEDNIKAKILQAWSTPPHVVEDAQEFSQNSSGLAIVSQKDRMMEPNIQEFDFTSGSDSFASKGILRTSIDPGFGKTKIEFYNTHMNAAGGASGRVFQLAQLATFIKRTHKQENLAILAGDFNVEATGDIVYAAGVNPYTVLTGGGGSHDDLFRNIDSDLTSRVVEALNSDEFSAGMTEYEVLALLLNEVGMTDLWVNRNGTPGYTLDNYERDSGQLSDIREQICKPAPDSPTLCNDFDVPASSEGFAHGVSSKRIDYIFVSEPHKDHTLNLDFTRPRRTRYLRESNAPERNKIDMISDHLGLTTELVISPVVPNN